MKNDSICQLLSPQPPQKIHLPLTSNKKHFCVVFLGGLGFKFGLRIRLSCSPIPPPPPPVVILSLVQKKRWNLRIKPRQSRSKCFPIYYSLIIVSFDAVSVKAPDSIFTKKNNNNNNNSAHLEFEIWCANSWFTCYCGVPFFDSTTFTVQMAY